MTKAPDSLTADGNVPAKHVRADLYEAQAAEIERLRGDLAKAVEAFGCWNRMMNNPAYDMGEMVSEFDAIARTTLAALTGAQKDGN